MTASCSFVHQTTSDFILRQLYTLTLYLLVPWVLLRLALRGLRTPAYWRRWAERFGYVPKVSEPTALWIHAVSVGEVQATLPLIRALRERIDPARILITTMTPTGSDRIRALYGDQPAQLYTPYDLPGAVARFLDRTRPQLALIMETEIWPNLFHACRRRGIPVFMVNARMSERSFQGYRRVSRLTAQTLGQVAGILAQGDEDRRRLVELGAPADRLHVTGSVKFDIPLPPSLAEQAAALRRGWGVARPVWVAASTHQGEDEVVLQAFANLLQSFPNALLILVPRHPERFSSVRALCVKKHFPVVSRSEGDACNDETRVFIGDTMGELTLFLAAADVAFVGGSLVPVGGHNPLEPVALGVPVVFGPHMFNFAEMSRWLMQAGAAVQVGDAEELARQVGSWLASANMRHDAGQRGRQVVERHKGAADAVLKLLEPYLPVGNP